MSDGGGAGRSHDADWDTAERELYDELYLIASNTGEFYPHDPVGAADHAFRVQLEIETRNLREAFDTIRDSLVEEIRENWE